MSSSFSFPPETYSAVYGGDDRSNVSVNVVKCSAVSCEAKALPHPEADSPQASLFGCFHCAFRSHIKTIRKDRPAAKTKRGKAQATGRRSVLHTEDPPDHYVCAPENASRLWDHCLLHSTLETNLKREPLEVLVVALRFIRPFAETTIGTMVVESTSHMAVTS